MYNNIVFDMGNVLIMYYPEKTLRKYLDNEEDIKLIMNEFYNKGLVRYTDRGVKTYADIIEDAAKRLPPRLTALLKKLYIDNCYGCTEMPVFPEMYQLVEKLRDNGYKLYLLSNAGFDFYTYSKQIPAISLMDGVIISCEYKVLKPEPEIYNILFDKFGIKPSESIFIDDMQENIDGAKNCGMDGICFSPSFENVSVLINKLKNKGIKTD